MLQDLALLTGGTAITEDLGKTTNSMMNEMRAATVAGRPTRRWVARRRR